MDSQLKPSWLEDAVFYEIYPQSFYDSNGDGIGDIPGIIQKLDYIKSLGVTAVWLNPCFESPFQDAGYDVADYYKVAPRYGTNEDLKRLFAEAKQRGLRILLDLVPGHTSITNPWFKESCKAERNEYSDWFIWTDTGWTWEVPGLRFVSGYAERNGCYITNFFYCQPALNYGFANPDPAQPWQQPVNAPGPLRVRQELRNIMSFWLDMGASGFRVDMAGSLVKFDYSGKETAALWREMRAWLDQNYPEACLVSEWGKPATAINGGFHVDFMLPFGTPGFWTLSRKQHISGPGRDPYGFSFFEARGCGNIREFLDEYLYHYEQTEGKGSIGLVSGNHDQSVRLAHQRTPDEVELFFMFILSMPGAPFIYYGDEIGMRTVEGLPSKEGSVNRTGVRTPMQWSEAPGAGFSTAPASQLYLPVDELPGRPTVDAQEADPSALLHRVRRLVELRKAHPALCSSGSFNALYAEAGSYPFVYQRSLGDESIVTAVNPANRPVEVELPAGLFAQEPATLYGCDHAITLQGDKWVLKLPGISGGIYK